MNKKISNVAIIACLFTVLASHTMEEKTPQSHDVMPITNRDWEIEQKVWTLYDGLFSKEEEERFKYAQCVIEDPIYTGLPNYNLFKEQIWATEWGRWNIKNGKTRGDKEEIEEQISIRKNILRQKARKLEKLRQEMKDIKHNVQCSEEIDQKLLDFGLGENKKDPIRFGELTIADLHEEKVKSLIACISNGKLWRYYPLIRNAIAGAVRGGYYDEHFIETACGYNDFQLVQYILMHRDTILKKHNIDVATAPYSLSITLQCIAQYLLK